MRSNRRGCCTSTSASRDAHPEGEDRVWLAIDAKGHVAAFVTGGVDLSCDFDFIDFHEEIRRISQSGSAADIAGAVTVLERLWQTDKSLGVSLTWLRLTEPNFRKVVVEHRAPAIREGRSKLPLGPLQQYAVSLEPTSQRCLNSSGVSW
jgi:hypothetical protein